MSATKSSSSPQRADGGAQAADLLVGGGDPVGVHRSRDPGAGTRGGRGSAPGRRAFRAGGRAASHASFHASTSLAGPATNAGVVPSRSRSAVTVGATARASGRGAGHSSALWLTIASVYSCRRCSSSRRRASASAAITLGRGLRVAPLFETNEVVDADPGERRHFLAAQTRRSPAAVVGQSDVARLQLLAASTEELGHRRHPNSMPSGAGESPWPRQYQDQPGLLGLSA